MARIWVIIDLHKPVEKVRYKDLEEYGEVLFERDDFKSLLSDFISMLNEEGADFRDFFLEENEEIISY